MNGNGGGAPTDREASQPTPEELDREPDAAAGGDAAQENDKPSPGKGGDSSADGPDAIDLDSVHDRAS